MSLLARTRKIGLLLFKIGLTAGVLLVIAWKFDLLAALRLLSTVTASTVAICLVLLLAQTWMAGVRLSTVTALFGGRISSMMAARATLEAAFINQAFISFIGGDAFRIWRIHAAKVPLSHATSAVVLDRVAGFIANHLVFVALLPFVVGQVESTTVQFALAALAAAGIGGIFLILALGLLVRQKAPADLLPARWRNSRLALMIVDLSTVGLRILANPAESWRICGIGAVIAVLNCVIFLLILRDWGVTPALARYCAMLVPGVMEIALLPLSVAGWGLREGAALIGFSAVGLNSETGLAASAAFGILSLAFALLGGLLLLAERFSTKADVQ